MNHRQYTPIMSRNCTANERERVLSDLMEAETDTVFLATEQEPFFRTELREECLKNLRENVRFFRDKGLEVGIWTRGFGFGTPVPQNADPAFDDMTRLRSIAGREAGDAFCPIDPVYRKWYGEWFAALCSCGATIVMIDDDLCQSVRPGLGCFCKRHKNLLAKALSLPADSPALADSNLRQTVFTGAPTPARAAYIQTMGDSLRAFCRFLREIADRIDPNLRLGFCAGYTSFDSEGATADELTKILAGRNRPFLRLSGAPYWTAPAVNRFPATALADVIEFVRMQIGFCPEDTELFHEADTYPRPRALIPAALGEAYDCALRTEPRLGAFDYLFDYFASPDYETGYLREHRRYAPLREQIDRAFADTVPYGVRVIEGKHKLVWAHLPETFPGEKPLMRRALSRAGGFLAGLGIPTTYAPPQDDPGEVPAAVCFGENARLLVGKPLPRRLVLDIPAAQILRESGMAVGFSDATQIPPPLLTLHGNERAATGALPLAYRLTLQAGAQPLTVFSGDGLTTPAVYRFRSGETELLVYAIDAYAGDPRTAFSLSCFRAEELADFLQLPYPKIPREPNFYQICRKRADGQLVSLFLNLSLDTAENLLVTDVSAGATVAGVEAHPERNGIRIASPVPPFHGFVLTQQTK